MLTSVGMIGLVFGAWTSWFGGLGESVLDQGWPFGISWSLNPDGLDHAGTDSGSSDLSLISAPKLTQAVMDAKKCPALESASSIEIYALVPIM